MDENARQQLYQGIAAARSGDRELAWRLFQELSDRDPNLEAVWLYLGILAETPEISTEKFYRALGVDPRNQPARKGMEWALSWLSQGTQPPLPPELRHLTPRMGVTAWDDGDGTAQFFAPEPLSSQELAALQPIEAAEPGDDHAAADAEESAILGVGPQEPQEGLAPALEVVATDESTAEASQASTEVTLISAEPPVVETSAGVSEAQYDPGALPTPGAPPEGLIDQGRVLLDAGRFGEAALALRAAASGRPDSVEAHGLLAMALCHLGLMEEAFGGFYLVTELQPDSVEAHANLGLLFAERYRLNEAETAFRTALSLNDSLAEVHIGLADVLQGLDRLDEAVAEWKVAADLRPDLPEVHANLAEAYTSRGQLEEAADEYRQLMEQRPNDAQAHLKHGEVLVQLGRTEAAAEQFQAATELEESLAPAYFGLGWALRDLGRREEVIAAFSKAIHLDPDYAAQCMHLIAEIQAEPTAKDEGDTGRRSGWRIFGRGGR